MSSKLRAGIPLVALILVLPPAALADSAVCEQYPDLPQCTVAATGGAGGSESTGGDESAGGGDSAGGSAGIPGGSGPGGGSAEPGKAGELPFTGYPLSPLAAAFLILLAAGVGIRSCLAIRRRLAPSASGS